MPSRLTLVLALLLAVALVGGLWALDSRNGYKATSERLEAQLGATEERLARIQVRVAVAERKRQLAEQSMREVLDANPDWSNAAVPEPVADGLCSTIRCK